MAELEKIIDGVVEADVDFLDKTHETLLTNRNNYPGSVVDELNDLIKNGLSITGREFLIYYLFHKKGCGIPQDEFIENLSAAEGMMALHLQYIKPNICKRPNRSVTRPIAENIGESIGMLALAKCFGVSNADWDVIPESNKCMTLDFKLCVSELGTIQLETKGTAAKKINLSGPTKSILEKKKSTEKPDGNYYYGSIVAIDNKRLKCYLLDPPANDEKQDLKRLMLISRMRYYNRLFSIIAPKSELISIVDERVVMLENNAFDLNELPVLKPEKRSHFNYHGNNRPTFFFNAYYQSEGGKFGGRGFYIDESSLFFVGVTNELLCEIVDQDVRFITRDYRATNDKKNSGKIISDIQQDGAGVADIDAGYSLHVKISMPINALHRDNVGSNGHIADGKFFSIDNYLDVEGELHFINGIVIGVLNY
ncbi:TPA: hypothetical protein ACXE51_002088 [Serratia marcescens]